ncbi:hypothetical protein Lal_00040970 [Lupinus albus]|nr:hypothetical protein Lal_00040970 [Lupinus albus]
MAHLELSISWCGSTKQPHRYTYLKFENRSRSFGPIPKSNERFARQYRCGPPPEFPLASPRSSIVHHLSGPDRYALTRTLHRRSGSVGGATHKGIPPISFLAPYGFICPLTRTHVRLNIRYFTKEIQYFVSILENLMTENRYNNSKEYEKNNFITTTFFIATVPTIPRAIKIYVFIFVSFSEHHLSNIQCGKSQPLLNGTRRNPNRRPNKNYYKINSLHRYTNQKYQGLYRYNRIPQSSMPRPGTSKSGNSESRSNDPSEQTRIEDKKTEERE